MERRIDRKQREGYTGYRGKARQDTEGWIYRIQREG